MARAYWPQYSYAGLFGNDTGGVITLREMSPHPPYLQAQRGSKVEAWVAVHRTTLGLPAHNTGTPTVGSPSRALSASRANKRLQLYHLRTHTMRFSYHHA